MFKESAACTYGCHAERSSCNASRVAGCDEEKVDESLDSETNFKSSPVNALIPKVRKASAVKTSVARTAPLERSAPIMKSIVTINQDI